MAKNEWTTTTRLIDAAVAILKAENPMTIRQLFYRLVSVAEIENCLRDYQRLSKAMTKAREDDRVDYDWIVDRSRTSYGVSGWTNLEEMERSMESRLRYYSRDAWQDQPHHVEIWCEKDAVTGSIEEVWEDYGISDVEAIRGFNSTTKIHEAALRLLRHQTDGKKVTIFYLGDWDPSGADIERDLTERLFEHQAFWYRSGHGNIEIKRIAIFKADITRFRLPPLRVKVADPRANRFLRKHGNRAVELDALPPTELRARLRRAIESVIDQEAWKRAKVVEEAQRATCQRYLGVFRKMLDNADQE